MEFRQLRYFKTVAECRGFTRAAEVLRIAQPALSSQIQKLEDELQEQLLIRHSRGIELTDAGRRLLGHARTILHQIDLAREDMQDARDDPAGLIRVGMPRSVSDVLAVQLVREAGLRAPSVSIRIVEHFSETLYSQLLDRELDIALSYSTENSDRVTAESISTQKLILVSPIGAQPPASRIIFSDAVQLPLILRSPTHVITKMVSTAASEKGIEINVAHEIDSSETALNLVEAGIGHTILPEVLAMRHLRSGSIRTRTIVEPELERTLYLLRLAQNPPGKALLFVRELLLELLHERSGFGNV